MQCSTYPKNRTRVVFVVLQRNTAVPRTIRVEDRVGLHSPIGECCARTCGNRSTSAIFSIAPREETSHETRTPTGSVLGHVLTWNRAGSASAFAIEEDQEDESTNQGDSSKDTNHNACDGTPTQFRPDSTSSCRCGISASSLTCSSNSDCLDLATRVGL